MGGRLRRHRHRLEYPNACGNTCDSSGRAAFKNVMAALRAKFGSGNLVTAAITADATAGGKIDAADYAASGAVRRLVQPDDVRLRRLGRGRPHGSALPTEPYSGIPKADYHTSATIAKLKGLGIPASKLLLGIGFYGRGWTGVTQAAPGGTAHRTGGGNVRAGHRRLQGTEGEVPGDGHGRRHGVRQVRYELVELRHPVDHRGEDGLQEPAGPGRHLLLELSGDTTNGELIKAIN